MATAKSNNLTVEMNLSIAVLDTVGALVVVLDTQGRIVLFNKACQSVTEYSQAEVLGQYVWDLFILPEEKDAVHNVFTRLTLGHFPNQHTNYWRTRSGDKRLIAWNNTAIADASNQLAYIIATGIDVTEQRAAQQKLEEQQQQLEALVSQRTAELRAVNERLESMANHDGLTDLYNRRYFDRALDAELRRVTRSREALSLMICDVDHFKKYNDTYGHVAGDDCLREIASLMKRRFQRAGDVVSRFGGEEFCIILPNTGVDEAIRQAQGLMQAVWDLDIEHRNSDVADRVTLSIGIATDSGDRSNASNAILRDADRALYKAKASGRNQIVHCQSLQPDG